MFVLTVGNGVYGFTYDSIVGEFILSHPNMKARARRAPGHRMLFLKPRRGLLHFSLQRAFLRGACMMGSMRRSCVCCQKPWKCLLKKDQQSCHHHGWTMQWDPCQAGMKTV